MEEVSETLIKNACLANLESAILVKLTEALKSLKTPEPTLAGQLADIPDQSSGLTNNGNHQKLLLLSNVDLVASRCGSGCNSAEWVLRNLIKEQEHVDILISCLDNDDAFVAYSACKAIATLICSVKSQGLHELADLLITKPFNKLNSERGSSKDCRTKERTVHRWEVVTNVLERLPTQVQQKIEVCCTNHPDVNTDETGLGSCFCKTVLQLLENPQEHGVILRMVEENTSSQKDSQHIQKNENCLMSILLLIEACLKYAIKNLNGSVIRLLKNCESFLTNITDSLCRCSNPEVYKKVVDLLNCYIINMNECQEPTLVLSTKLLSLTTGDMFERAPYRNEYMAFGGYVFSDFSNLVREYHQGDLEMLRKLTMLVVKNCEVVFKTTQLVHSQNVATMSFGQLSLYLNSKLGFASESICDWLFHLYADNDTSLICIMFALLRVSNYSTLINIDPHKIFRRFLETVAYDHSVLLDFLISDETEFLAYFVRYLHTVIANWSAFKNFHSCLEDANRALETVDMGLEKEGNRTRSTTTCEPDEINLVQRKRDHDVDDGVNDFIACKGKQPRCCENYQTESDANHIASDAMCNVHNSRVVEPLSCTSEGLDSGPLVQDKVSDDNDDVKQDDGYDDNNDDDDDKDGASSSLDKIMSTFIRLRLSIDRIVNSELFPFRVASLLKLLEDVEEMYEN